MRDFVRVRDVGTGHVYSVLAQEAETNPTAYEVLVGEKAVDECGDPLPGVTETPTEASATPPAGDQSGAAPADPPADPEGVDLVPDPSKPLGRRPRTGTQSQEA